MFCFISFLLCRIFYYKQLCFHKDLSFNIVINHLKQTFSDRFGKTESPIHMELFCDVQLGRVSGRDDRLLMVPAPNRPNSEQVTCHLVSCV